MSLLKSVPSSRGSSKQWRSRGMMHESEEQQSRCFKNVWSHLWWCNKKLKASFCPQHLLQTSFSACINFSRFTSSACLSGRGLITGLSHSANFWSWTVFCLWSQSSAEKVGNSSPSTFYQNCSDSDWTEIKRKQTDLTGISGEISFLYYLLKGLICVRTHVHVKRKASTNPHV